jgi:DNA-binding XRE family transcriptional regulator
LTTWITLTTLDDMAHNASVPQWSLADRLRKIRRDRGLTQEQMAHAVGVNPPTWSAWEANRTRPHDVIELATTIERVFGVPAAWTLGVLSPPDQSATNPLGIPAQPRRRWDDQVYRAAALA